MFSNFSQRSVQKELIDLGPEYYSNTEYADCLKKLFDINKYMGFFRHTVKILKKYSPKLAKNSRILDVGCASGLFLLNLNRLFPYKACLGIDISGEAITLAQENLARFKQKYNLKNNILFAKQKTLEINLPANSMDIILATLVCHHIESAELIGFLKDIYNTASKAVIINDLNRSKWAYFLYGLISPLLFRNKLITHDGLISIQRGFKRAEWKDLLSKAGISHYKIYWRFPFWWQVVLWKTG